MLRFKPPEFNLERIDIAPLNNCGFMPITYFTSHGIHCKGSGGGGDSYDSAYNSRMASIYEEQNSWAKQYYNFWESYEKPYEIAKIEANQKLLPGQTELAEKENSLNIAQVEADMRLLPDQEKLSQAKTQSALDLVPLQTEYEKESLLTETEKQKNLRPVQEAFYNDALNGVDADSWASMAQEDASRAFMASQTASSMALARRGATPGSGAYAGASNENAFARATSLGTAATAGREAGEKESFNRKTTAMQM